MLCFVLGTILAVDAQKYNFQPYDLENDLGISSVSAVANSDKGFLYIGDNEKIHLFNGKSSEILIPEFNLPFSEFKNLVEGDEGDLFLLSNNQLKIFGSNESLVAESVNTFVCSASQIYFGNENGVNVFDRKNNIIHRPDVLLQLANFQINDLLLIDNNLYIASNKGLYVYHTKEKTLDDFNLTSSFQLQEMAVDGGRELWAYDLEGTLYAIDLQTKKVRPFYNEGFSITNLSIDSSERVWVGTRNKGILRYDQRDNLWKTIDQRNGLPDNRISHILIDSWGMVWIVSADNTLSKFIDREYELYNVYDGMASDEVNAIFNYEEDLIFSAGSKGIFTFSNKSFLKVHELDVKSAAIYKDSSDLWIGTNGSGLIRVSQDESTVFRKNAGLPSDWISGIVKASDGSIWIGTPSNGLAQLSERDSSSMTVNKLGIEEGLSDPYISALFASPSGPVYFGTRSGKIGVLDFGNFRELPADSINSEVTSICEGSYGEIYFSTSSDGLFKWANEKKGNLRNVPNYPKNIAAISYRDNRLWAVNDKGITDGENKFTTGEGFPSKRIVKGSMVAKGNRNWIACKDGLLSIGELQSGHSIMKPRIHFNNVQANFKSLVFQANGGGESVQIKYNELPVSFEYEGVDIHANKELQYSYILEGQDKLWSPWTKNDNPIFNNLNAGNYTFKVRVRSDDESISDPISYDFTINGPLWKEWWFFPSLALALGLFAFMIFRNRIKAVRLKNEEEKAQLELKNRLLELEQKANQLQMNPHFIFNALNSIQATVAKEDYKDARKEISDFAILMRSILSNSKESVIALEDELQLLRKYIDIERKCRTLGFKYEINLPDELDIEEAQIPPMLIQPFIENAIIHGLSKKDGGKLSITFSLLEESVILVQIEDDGVGYENSKVSSVNKKHKSVAIEVTKERLETLLNKKHFPVLEIRQKGVEGGTLVNIKIPLTYEY